ncbi:SRPBCC family protein [Ornithinimicrobium sp. F0845]|uniref:SRPBCC family protein n=1 Tax=Ornithinimicrobium sp. F0845 TaxID=2926412 RepID=UPI001FF5AA92|nr:SRPBCC family protein [Ornithinimicrobium sp. F0845]MCK0112578.1 SRPBCC family protein [Ornithinimicrobium sp. F0845]
MEQSITVDITAPPERVWAVLCDVESWPEWTPTVTSVRRLDEGLLRVGSRAVVNQPRLPETEYVVTELEPDRSFTWVASAPGVRTTARHLVDPLPEGGARVRLSVAQAGLLGVVMGRFLRGLTDRYLANEANGLRARAEQDGSEQEV